MKKVQTGIIILAAGKSSRLGQAKQLVKYQGKNLLQKIIDEVANLINSESVVVLGANHQHVAKHIDFKNSTQVINPEWEGGMTTSMQAGLKFLLNKYPNFNQVMLLLCDQPYVDAKLLKNLIEAKASSKKGIVCCGYANTVGVPVIFEQMYFDALLQLKSKEGAKKVILAHQDDIEVIGFPKGAIDIDTPEDLNNLNNSYFTP